MSLLLQKLELEQQLERRDTYISKLEVENEALKLKSTEHIIDTNTSIPKGYIEVFHKIHRCWIAGGFNEDGDFVEKTKTTAWPVEAFTHYRNLSLPPKGVEL